MKKIGGIYKIVNLINGKVYIGQTENFDERKRNHFGSLRLNKHKNLHLQNAFNKYGEDNFILVFVETILIVLIENNQYYCEREQYWMDEYKSLDRRYGYNLKRAFPVQNHCEETKEKMRADNSSNSKLTWNQVKEIRRLYNTNKHIQNNLAEKYNIDQTTISNIVKNKQWVDKEYVLSNKKNGANHHNSKLTWQQAIEIKKLYKTNKFSHRDLAKKYDVHHQTIFKIINNASYKRLGNEN